MWEARAAVAMGVFGLAEKAKAKWSLHLVWRSQ